MLVGRNLDCWLRLLLLPMGVQDDQGQDDEQGDEIFQVQLTLQPITTFSIITARRRYRKIWPTKSRR